MAAAQALVKFYQSGSLNQKTILRILAQREKVMYHSDWIEPCGPEHHDAGIGVDFPL